MNYILPDYDFSSRIVSCINTTTSLPFQWLIAGIALLFVLFILIILEIKTRKKPPKHPFPFFCCKMSAFALILCIGIWGMASIKIGYTAVQHGCQNLRAYSVESILERNDLTPVEDELPEQVNGSLILYYRYGCSDCEAIYQDLKEATAGLPNVYWVATRSKQGEKLRNQYPVTEVPTGVYVSLKGTALTKNLITSGNNPHLDEDNLTQLFFAMNADIGQTQN